MELKLLIKEKEVLLGEGLTVYVGDIRRNFYNQFPHKNVFGVNFSYGSYDGKNEIKIFVIDGQVFDWTQVVGYSGNCLRLKSGENQSRFFLSAVDNDNNDIVLSFIFQKVVENFKDVDLLFVNEVDGELGARDKIFLLKTLEVFATKIPILFVTKDIASLRISEIKFNVIDENNTIAEYFKMVEAIQNGQYNEYCQNLVKKDEKSKQRKSNKKVGNRRPSNKKL